MLFFFVIREVNQVNGRPEGVPPPIVRVFSIPFAGMRKVIDASVLEADWGVVL